MKNDISRVSTRGVHHVGLTVPDVTASVGFFVNTLGFELLGERAEYPAAFVTDGITMITLWQATDPSSATPFDRKNVIGLHHLAIAVENADTLDVLHDRLLIAPDVAIEFAPEPQGTGGNRHLMCSMPGGIRLELIAPRQ